MDEKTIDWNAIKTEYVAGGTSYRKHSANSMRLSTFGAEIVNKSKDIEKAKWYLDKYLELKNS